MKTVAIDLWAGQVRGAAPNAGTRIVPTEQLTRAIDARSCFLRAYPKVADRCRAVDEPGVALIAIDETTGAPAGLACIRARVDRHVVAIVGRHDRCDLYLAGRDALALRQLAVVVSPVQSWRAGSSDVSFRMLDLRTTGSMVDEEGRQLRGLRSEGPAIVRCAGYLVFALPLGDATDWPASATDAWAYLPDRVYFDELTRSAGGSILEPVPGAPRPRHLTIITRIGGPRDPEMRLVTAGDHAGTLDLVGPGVRDKLEIGHEALRDGVLLGRYPRCNAAPLAVDESLSRVHALLVHVDDRLLVIDTASTNGIRRAGGANARVLELTAGGELDFDLGCETRARWTWVS